MARLVSFGIITAALLLPSCSSSEPDGEPPPPAPEPIVIPPPPRPFVDVLPEFKKASRAFLDSSKKLHEAVSANPPPTYQVYWKECEPLEEIYTKVISNEPKAGPGANAFDRIHKIRDSLFQTRLILKNKEGLKAPQIVTLLEAEAEKRKPIFDEAEFFWKQTPEFTKRKE